MTLETLTAEGALAAADRTVDALIADALAGNERAHLTDAPAGAGKTGAVVRLVGELADAGARIGVTAQTNEQAFDIVHRVGVAFPGQQVRFFPASGMSLPAKTLELPNVDHVEKSEVMDAQVVVATGHKWAYAAGDLEAPAFDYGVIDEMYQMTSGMLLRTAGLFEQLEGLGDPGQLDPFSTVSDERWAGLAVNPVLNAVDAVLAHHPELREGMRSLPVTRRLPPSAAGVVRDAFYPDLDFAPGSKPEDRELRLRKMPKKGIDPRAVEAWDLAATSGWAYVKLPARPTQQVDEEAVAVIGELIQSILQCDATLIDEKYPGEERELTADRIAVGVVHTAQRDAITFELQQRGLGDVVCDTANRLQGREFDALVVLHPLSGRIDASEFHLDAGRLCVLATRHRHACVVVGRGGTQELLEEYPPPGELVLGPGGTSPFAGWEAHVELLRHLRAVQVEA